jgi:hypothetical protein
VISHFHLSFTEPRPLPFTVFPLPPCVVKPATHGVLVTLAGYRVTRSPGRPAADRAAVGLAPVARRADSKKPVAPATRERVQHERQDQASAHGPPSKKTGVDSGPRRWEATSLVCDSSHPEA